MDLVEPKNSLAVALAASQIVADIEARLLKIPDFMNYKSNLEFTRYCCELCQAASPQSAVEDLQVMAITILTKIFNLSTSEVVALTSQVQYLFVNKNVKKVKTSRIISSAVSGWIKKKLL